MDPRLLNLKHSSEGENEYRFFPYQVYLTATSPLHALYIKDFL
jgi:hypothetical protein